MGSFKLQIALKEQGRFSKKKKSCTKSEKLLEALKVAPNLKSCSKVAEQFMDSPTEPSLLQISAKKRERHSFNSLASYLTLSLLRPLLSAH